MHEWVCTRVHASVQGFMKSESGSQCEDMAGLDPCPNPPFGKPCLVAMAAVWVNICRPDSWISSPSLLARWAPQWFLGGHTQQRGPASGPFLSPGQLITYSLATIRDPKHRMYLARMQLLLQMLSPKEKEVGVLFT